MFELDIANSELKLRANGMCAILELDNPMEQAMSKLSRDTAQEIEDMQVAILRKMTAQQKLEQVNQLSLAMRELAMVGIQQYHPNETPEQHHWRLAVQLLGQGLTTKVYGPFPE